MKAIDVTRLRERRVFQGRKFEARPALFPGYCFVLIELQWHAARWAPGTLGLVMEGSGAGARAGDRRDPSARGQRLDRGLQTILSTWRPTARP